MRLFDEAIQYVLDGVEEYSVLHFRDDLSPFAIFLAQSTASVGALPLHSLREQALSAQAPQSIAVYVELIFLHSLREQALSAQSPAVDCQG